MATPAAQCTPHEEAAAVGAAVGAAVLLLTTAASFWPLAQWLPTCSDHSHNDGG